MKPPAWIAPVALGSLLMATAPASASGYVSAGIGPAPSLGGELDSLFDGGGHRSARVGLGYRFGPVGLELGVGGYGLHGTTARSGDGSDGRAISASASVTGHLPLLLWLNGYGRLGLQRTWVSSSGPMDDLSGSGHLIGLGLELEVPLVITTAAIWLEVNRETVDLSGGDEQYQGTADMVMLGVRLEL